MTASIGTTDQFCGCPAFHGHKGTMTVVHARLLYLIGMCCAAGAAVRARCDPSKCRLEDNCLCMSSQPPGNLSVQEMPQFVMLTFDDAVNEENMDFYRHLLAPGKRKNRANGCNMVATFFVSAGFTDYSFVHELHSVGNEIALHSITHRYNYTYWKTLDAAGWEAELLGGRDILRDYALIPEEDMVGARAPFLEPGKGDSYVVIQEHGLLYDSSVTVESNFEFYHYHRAPFTFFIHETWLHDPERAQGFLTFVDWLLTMDDVFFVTVEEVVRFMQNPKPLGEYVQSKCSKATEFSRCPEIHSCEFTEAQIRENRFLTSCRRCPERYPWIREGTAKESQRDSAAGPATLERVYYSTSYLFILCSVLICLLALFTKRLIVLFRNKHTSRFHGKVSMD
ncbi:chitin deacetylase 1-like isoform X3 [Haemaphysalis longicornis]